MSETMIFSVKAQVYILDQATQNWTPATFSVIPVSFYSDASSGRTRIIAMENSEPKINSVILPGMSFHKPSETFGQWLDPASSQLFGLNFTSKADCDNFAKTFAESMEKKKEPAAAATATATATVAAPAKVETKSSESPEELKKEIAALKKLLADKNTELETRMNEIQAKSTSLQNSLKTSVDTLTSTLGQLSLENEIQRSQLDTLKKSASQSSNSDVKLKKVNENIEKLKKAIGQNNQNTLLWQNCLTNLTRENVDLKEKVKKMAEIQQKFASLNLK